jgi:uncharacterized DUF497 family protein
MYSFEYDNQKSSFNEEKHGIDFLDSQVLWDDPNIVEVRAKSDTEARFLVIGKINNKHWSAVITYRDENIVGYRVIMDIFQKEAMLFTKQEKFFKKC